MSIGKILLYVAVMAGVTYLIRMLPLTLIRRKLENQFVISFMYYMPFAVLSAMVIPDIFYCSDMVLSAAVGLAVAVVLSLFEKKLLTVAIFACLAVFLTESVFRLFG
ncbi:MAG TPA: AzlD domain-containing protein [Oscillospiraceae bacterium]|nr:AzlD domain-containing protein [Oscillospiraceae bacterium]HPF56933.1 AzlD domain-containing protein [Clostridiales bacterium]HPK36362.1 AzlD domain-containing protein [Oscillospiraceae bacterium]HPR76864.1 AzlD domain-containing protein [Oscillospiraceae bacterium]